MNSKILIRRQVSVYTSSVLIPKELEYLLLRKIKSYGSIRSVLHFLIKSGNSILDNIKLRKNTGKILYQAQGMSLVRYDFRPYASDWEYLRLLALNKRISMTRLFTIMLVILCEKENNNTVPTYPEEFTLIQNITATAQLVRLNLDQKIYYKRI